MNPFVTFMSSQNGRIVRIVVGIALIAWAFLSFGGTWRIILTLVGALPLLAGIFDICVLAPLFGCPIKGSDIRAGKK